MCPPRSPAHIAGCSQAQPNWEEELKQEIRDECSKFGRLVHVDVVPGSAGEVYLKYADAHGAQAGVAALDGRWFASKQITATHIAEGQYHARFPDAKFV